MRILRSAGEFDSHPFSAPQVPIHYCSAVKMATEGASLKLGLADMSCDTAPKTLGLEPGFLDEDFVGSYVTGGLYRDREHAERLLSDVVTLSGVVGVALFPTRTIPLTRR